MYNIIYFIFLVISKGLSTYYVISRGGGGSQILTVDYGGLAVDYVIKILIFTPLNNSNLTIFNSNSTQFHSDSDTI